MESPSEVNTFTDDGSNIQIALDSVCSYRPKSIA